MSVLVDYSCTGCRSPHEAWVARPIPAERPCPSCGAPARRRFGGAFLRGAPAPAPVAAKASAGPSLCQRFPAVPGLCHMNPEAARGWIARARGDGRALDRELARQEAAVAQAGADAVPSPVSHDHGAGSGRGEHGHGHHHADGQHHGPGANHRPASHDGHGNDRRGPHHDHHHGPDHGASTGGHAAGAPHEG